ncbi:MAG: sugar phosphate isomerase/epimerase family protein, partial [Pseudomonadota bacterium]|nr:sugar phosphate isomerase/epimerase family protein [Pseudomonadota bacterium]
LKISVSNIGLTAYDHSEELFLLGDIGISGLEVAPSRVWPMDQLTNIAGEVEIYRRQVELAGLRVIGLHSLFYNMPGLGLFKDQPNRSKSLRFLAELSKMCRDLGGKILTYGGGRQKGSLTSENAKEEALNFFSDLIPMIQEHGTCFCFEPLGPEDSDFINSVYESIWLVEQLNSPWLKVQLDAKALVQNGEAEITTFRSAEKYLVHFHANEPDLGVLGTSGIVNHKRLGQMLRAIGYQEFVSIEQRLCDESDPIRDIAASANIIKECYI